MSTNRHLAAILFTDIVGYTALMGEDEAKAFQLLKANRHLQKPLIEQFHGQWIKEIGDGVLAIFSSATDAVACACTILNEAYKVPGLQLRIGIHLGDIVLENGDAFGDGVNIAARLQALAPINGIWLSETVFQNVFNKKGIEANFVKEENLKNVREPVRIYEVNFKTFSPQQFMSTTSHDESNQAYHQNKFVSTKELTQKPANHKKKSVKRNGLILLCLMVIVAIPVSLLVSHWKKVDRVKNELIPEIQKLSTGDWFFNSSKAFLLAKEAEQIIPGDTILQNLYPKFSSQVTIYTTPPDASVYWKEYNSGDDHWVLLGNTPLKKIWIPFRFPVLKIEKKGFLPVNNPPLFFTSQLDLSLDSVGKYPDNMVRVRKSISGMLIVGLEQYEGREVGDFLMDKFEVTNKEFKEFLDSGGYKKKVYWDFPIYSEGKEITWEQAVELFKDKTGRQGPSTWEAGTYPNEKADHPVTGVSWYEAMAFAKFSGKEIPTVYHWSQVASTFNTWDLIPNSNFNGAGTVPVGTLKGINNWGVYDVAGNAREWCYNASTEKDKHYILGGGWNDANYSFNDAFVQSSIDRSQTNGFRCMKQLPGDTGYSKLTEPLALDFRDYKKEKPVDDKTFELLFREFNYDKSAFNAHSQIRLDSSFVKIEKIEINAAYNAERLLIYLFTPKNVPPPYQTVLFFPGSGALFFKTFDYADELRGFDFLIKSGRAVAFPIVKGTYERNDGIKSDLQKENVFYKQHVIDWRQDWERSLDYLDTRNDIVHNNYGYFGWSWGSSIAPVISAAEPRFKAIVLHVGGLQMQKTFPEVDPLNFLSRMKSPILLLNGESDSFFPLETSQKPFFALIGSKIKEKKTYAGGHFVPLNELIKESLNWYDKYLGKVR